MFRRFIIFNINSCVNSFFYFPVAVDMILVFDSMLSLPPTFDNDIDIDFIFFSLPFVLKITLYTSSMLSRSEGRFFVVRFARSLS
jgi:hypothetical protein